MSIVVGQCATSTWHWNVSSLSIFESIVRNRDSHLHSQAHVPHEEVYYTSSYVIKKPLIWHGNMLIVVVVEEEEPPTTKKKNLTFTVGENMTKRLRSRRKNLERSLAAAGRHTAAGPALYVACVCVWWSGKAVVVEEFCSDPG